MSSTTNRRRVRLAGSTLAVCLLALAGCGGDDGDGGGTASGSIVVPTTLSGPAAVTTPPEGMCISRVPGQSLSEAEAVVRFSTTGVCPSYVTVDAGTKVRWTNDHTAPVTVTLSAAVATAPPSSGPEVFPSVDAGPVVLSESVAAGATLEHLMADAGTFHFRIDLIPTFLGTVEVR